MRALAVAFAAIAFLVAPAGAQLPGSFDHFATGFPLTGAHGRVDCASCHVSGRFKGTPQQCASCHDGTLAQGKINQHPNTSNLCGQCHVTNDWKEARVDHAGIMGNCATCHMHQGEGNQIKIPNNFRRGLTGKRARDRAHQPVHSLGLCIQFDPRILQQAVVQSKRILQIDHARAHDLSIRRQSEQPELRIPADKKT